MAALDLLSSAECGLWVADSTTALDLMDIIAPCAGAYFGFDRLGTMRLAQLITLLTLKDQRPPRPIMWEEQRRLLPFLPGHLASMTLFTLNTGIRDDVVCNLRWEWEIPIKQLGVSIFIVPPDHVKGEEGIKQAMVLVCNTVAQKVLEAQRGKHSEYVFVYRRERTKKTNVAPKMAYRPIQRMSNSGWDTARTRAGLDDLHFHDMRHTVGLRLRDSSVSEQTISAVLWHTTKTITGHYSMAQVVEIFEALELIKDESNRWNISLQSLIAEAAGKKLKA